MQLRDTRFNIDFKYVLRYVSRSYFVDDACALTQTPQVISLSKFCVTTHLNTGVLCSDYGPEIKLSNRGVARGEVEGSTGHLSKLFSLYVVCSSHGNTASVAGNRTGALALRQRNAMAATLPWWAIRIPSHNSRLKWIKKKKTTRRLKSRVLA